MTRTGSKPETGPAMLGEEASGWTQFLTGLLSC